MLQVKIWFQNRRMKWRNSKERELLAAGGSREQTLPNKNNPHPDLSDAELDKPKLDLTDISPASSPADHQSSLQSTRDRDDSVATSTYSITANGTYCNQFESNMDYETADESEEEINVT